MEPHPLWEYPSFPLSDPLEIFSFNFETSKKVTEPCANTIKIPIKNNGLLNGIAIWHELDYDDEFCLNTGLQENPKINQHLVWSKDYKQAVHILDKKYEITDSNRDSFKLNCLIKFEPRLGNFDIDFKCEP